MNDRSLYEKAHLPDLSFPIRVTRNDSSQPGPIFTDHWHEQVEILYFLKGQAIIACGSSPATAAADDLVVINSNELHSGHNISGPLSYYCINIDTSLIHGKTSDMCDIKYITPIDQELIVFNNRISGDHEVSRCVRAIILEYEEKKPAFELSVKSFVYRLLVLLLRSHIRRIMTTKEYLAKVRNLKRFDMVISYIEENYKEQLSLDELSKVAGLSSYHLCHLFKKATGRTLTEHIIQTRIDKAHNLFRSTNMNITEIALATGFSDPNYFSRIFKKHTGYAPKKARDMLLS